MLDEFEVYLISTASMNIHSDNTMAMFTNRFAEPLILEGDWRVALTEATFPVEIKNVTDSTIYVYSAKDGYYENSANVGDGAVKRPRRPQKFEIPTGMYPNVDSLLDTIQTVVPIAFNYSVQDLTGKVTLEFNEFEGLTFESNQIPSILGFDGVQDWNNTTVHIGYKQNTIFDVVNKHEGDYPMDITARTHCAMVYTDIIEYQHVGDAKAPLLRIIDTGRRLKNGSTATVTNYTQIRKSFTVLEYKKLLKNTIGSVKIEIRTDIGNLMPFVGTGKVFATLRFKKFD